MFRHAALIAAFVLAGSGAAHGDPAVKSEQATGRFDIQMKPGADVAPSVARFTFSKVFHGDLDATSTGEMLSSGSPASGQAGYVAIEQVTGRLGDRAGAFALQQFGTMDKSGMELKVGVVPGSGTGDLAGLAGSMTIDPAKNHAYVLTYTLPAAHAP